MKKDFNDFMALMNSKDFSKLAESITKEVKKDQTPESALFHANIIAFTTILKEYHEWANE